MKRTIKSLISLALIVSLLCGVCAYAEGTKITAMTVRTDTGSLDALQWAADQMKELYDVDCEIISVSGYYTDVKLAFEGGDIPTLVYLDDLNQLTLQKYGYLQDITEMVKQYGWLDKAAPGMIEFNNLRTPGQYYSVGTMAAPVVVYYNKDIFEELGVSIPNTYEELLDIMAKGKEAGYYSFEISGADMFSVWWMMSNLIFNTCGMEDVGKWYYLEETTDAFKDALLFAAEEVVSWKEKGYIREEVLGIDSSTLIPLFASGESMMLVSGDWDCASIESCGVNVGAFSFPTCNPDMPYYIVNAADAEWAITTASTPEETEAAGKFIDLLFSQEENELMVSAGYTPAVEWDASAANISELKREMMDCVAGVGIGFYLDNCVPGMYDVASKTLQRLVGGELDAQGYVDELLANYEELKANYLATA